MRGERAGETRFGAGLARGWRAATVVDMGAGGNEPLAIDRGGAAAAGSNRGRLVAGIDARAARGDGGAPAGIHQRTSRAVVEGKDTVLGEAGTGAGHSPIDSRDRILARRKRDRGISGTVVEGVKACSC